MEHSVKLCCSLRWLYGILSKHPTTPDPGYMLRLSHLLLEPYQENLLKNETILALTSPTLYVQAYDVVFPGEHLPESSFEAVTQALARKGGYVLEDDGTIVSVPMLAQQVPFREKSHLALLDVFMVQYASKIITVQRVVQTVRKLSTFNASKELPSKVEVELLLMLWLNKVSEAVYAKRADEINSLLQSTDPKQRKKSKSMVVKSGGYPAIPLITGDICIGISDGQNLAALMLHYAPNSCSWNDFKIKGHPLKRKKALKNLNFVCEFCSTHFAAPAFHLSPSEIVELGPSGTLKANILAMLANLFFCFELSGNDGFLRKGLISSSSSSLSNQNASDRTLVDRSSLHQHSMLSNSSKTSISSKPSSSKQRVAELGSHDPTLTNSTHAPRAFNAPFRSSLNKTQAKVLAAFGRDKSHLKGTHTQSSPLIQTQAVPLVPSNELISASTESLNLETQMKSSRCKNRGSFLSRLTNPLRLSRSTASHHEKTLQYSNLENEPLLPAEKASDGQVAKEVSMPQAMRESFTLDKQHTYASASAAGLPIINDKTSTPPLQASDEPDAAEQAGRQNSSSTRLTLKGDTIMLTNLLQLHHGDATYTIAAQKQPIPPNVKELRVNLRSFISNLQSETVHMEREAMIQRLNLYHPVEKKSERHLTTVVSGTASAPLVIAPSDTNIKAFQSVPAISPHVKKSGVSKNPSLEQFERDEYLIRLQTSEDNNIEIRHETQSKSQPEVGKGILKHHKPQQPPPSPFSNGEILEFPPSEAPHSDAAPPVSPGWARKGRIATTEENSHPEPTSKPSEYIRDEAVEPPPVETKEHVLLSGQAADQQAAEAEVEASVNPWGQRFHQNTKIESMKKKEQLIRSRMEERDRVRRLAAEERRLAEEQRAAEVRRAAEEQREAELRRLEEKIEKKSAKIRQKRKHEAPVPEHPVSASAADHNKETSNTIHFHFSNHHHHAVEGETEGTTSSVHEEPVAPRSRHAPTGMVVMVEGAAVNEYRGPECYIKPKSKSNLKIIRNAICSVCLAGEVNMALKQKTLAELEKSSASHVVILFRDTIGFKFRGIYAYNPGDRHVVRIYGTGPREITELMTSHLYKYNSGQKEFKEIPSRSLSVSVDALTIKTEYWQTAARRRRTVL